MNVKHSTFGVLIFVLLISPTTALSKPSVTLAVDVQGDGTVVSVPAGIDCPGQCSAQFPRAAGITLMATASEGWEFVVWSGGCTGADSSCVVKLVSDMSAAASFQVIPEPPPAIPAPVAQTGQVLCYNSAGSEIACAGTGQDGDLNAGVAWPLPRFTINGDGTVTDELTGLVWLQRVDCFHTEGYSYISWQSALTAANGLADGQCGLTDGSVAGDWRMPTAKELGSLIDYQFWNPAISNTEGTGKWVGGDPFVCENCLPGYGVEANSWFMSSTTCVRLPDAMVGLRAYDGALDCVSKALPNINMTMLWPVREM